MDVRIDLGFLTLVFIVLKLTGAINWSWWWVFSPILFAIALVFTLAIVVGIYHCIKE